MNLVLSKNDIELNVEERDLQFLKISQLEFKILIGKKCRWFVGGFFFGGGGGGGGGLEGFRNDVFFKGYLAKGEEKMTRGERVVIKLFMDAPQCLSLSLSQTAFLKFIQCSPCGFAFLRSF